MVYAARRLGLGSDNAVDPLRGCSDACCLLAAAAVSVNWGGGDAMIVQIGVNRSA